MIFSVEDYIIILNYKMPPNDIMKIIEVKNRTDCLLNKLLKIWGNSVRATHNFLSNEEIEIIKYYVPQAINAVQHLFIVENDNNEIIAFCGTENSRLEMIFIVSSERGKGVGKTILEYIVKNYNISEVTVNEQNTQAVGFYKHIGFESYKRSDLDEQGNPYPLLYMKLNSKNF